MIIRDLKITENNNFVSLECQVSWNNNPFKKAFIAVPKEYGKYLIANDADPFLIIFLIIACKYDEDIIIENAAVNEELCSKIEKIMIPAFAKMGNGTGKTKIIADKVKRETDNSKKIGATGISLGVDSFYSILTNTKDKNKERPISAVCLRYDTDVLENIDFSYLNKITKPKKEVAEKFGLKFILIITNLTFFCDQEFSFAQYHTFCNVGVINLIKKHIAYYYYATGFAEKEMIFSLKDSGLYENIIKKVLNYNEFTMYSSGGEVTRLEKTKYIFNNKIVQNYLDVCLNDSLPNPDYLNCSNCLKCIRTMTTLDVLGKLPLFDKVFDINMYTKNKIFYWGDVLYHHYIMKDIFASEIIELSKNKKYKIPKLSWFYFFKIGIKNQYNKIKRVFK